ncbi:hypothetical protein [Actinoplanes sp. HUAS TT8]|uniref:hypothetical protein n=1 Tax=Actinoplanes sp. HUAS TT8 TaxID=3447453 RepID=UPI003F520A21
MNRSLVPALLLPLIIAGCADQTTGSATATGATPQVSAASADPAVFPLDFARTGGFAGFDDRLHIGADGTMTVSRRGVSSAPVATDATVLAALQQVLTAPNLTTAAPASSAPVCADGFRYRLTTPGWTYTADDCSGEHPELERALDLLMPLLQAGGPSPS